METLDDLRRSLEDSWLPIPPPEEHEPRGIQVLEASGWTLLHLGRIGPFSNWVLPRRGLLAPAEVAAMLGAAATWFGERRTPWGIQVLEEHRWVREHLVRRGLHLVETVACMARDLVRVPPGSEPYPRVRPVRTREELQRALELDDSYAEHLPADRERVLRSAVPRLEAGSTRWFLARVDGEDVASAVLELGPDGRMAYLSGATTLPDFRGRGLYTELLQARLALAVTRGRQLATTHADLATSGPILSRHGFEELSRIEVYQVGGGTLPAGLGPSPARPARDSGGPLGG